jgi:hypothetical protein
MAQNLDDDDLDDNDLLESPTHGGTGTGLDDLFDTSQYKLSDDDD